MTEETKWVSTNKPNVQKYHTDPDCPNFPENVEPATEDDLRRSITQCTICRGQRLATLLTPKDDD